MISIRLPDNLEARLSSLALKAGVSKTALAREAILDHIEDLEDYYLAEARSLKNRRAIPFADVVQELGLYNSK